MDTHEYKWVKGKELLDLPRGVFRLGEAPDGLPYALILPEPDRLPLLSTSKSLIEKVAEDIGKDAKSTIALVKTITKIQSEALMINIPQYGKYFILPGFIKEILGKTLLERLLDVYNYIPQKSKSQGTGKTEQTTAPIAASFEEKGEAFEIPIVSKKLLLPIGDSPMLIGTFETAKTRDLKEYREVVFETLKSINHKIGFSTIEGWKTVKRDTLYKTCDLLCLRINMIKEILGIVVNIVKSAIKHHNAGQIHGDIKPSNILLTEAGAVLIDSLEIKPGEVSPALTVDYAAPEQVLSEPVSFTTDVYAIGRILQQLLNAVSFGEIRTFEVPFTSSGLKRIELHVCRGIYIDPGNKYLSLKEIPQWQKLLRRCLEFDPTIRIKPDELLNNIKKLVNNYESDATVDIGLRFGTLGRILEKNSKKLAWLVEC